jgi:hypothetical protein
MCKCAPPTQIYHLSGLHRLPGDSLSSKWKNSFHQSAHFSSASVTQEGLSELGPKPSCATPYDSMVVKSVWAFNPLSEDSELLKMPVPRFKVLMNIVVP